MPSPRSLACAILAFATACGGLVVAPAQAQVVAIGASNVSGLGVSSSDAFPAQLETMLREKGYSVRVINAGVPGDGTQQMLARFDSAIPGGTRVVILDVGGGLWNNAPAARRPCSRSRRHCGHEDEVDRASHQVHRPSHQLQHAMEVHSTRALGPPQ
jgi:hypothetical protein